MEFYLYVHSTSEAAKYRIRLPFQLFLYFYSIILTHYGNYNN